MDEHDRQTHAMELRVARESGGGSNPGGEKGFPTAALTTQRSTESPKKAFYFLELHSNKQKMSDSSQRRSGTAPQTMSLVRSKIISVTEKLARIKVEKPSRVRNLLTL
mmetsp:Transcript_33687/g.66723  ORF Transcript_33687/g.66723 Transcript_33687/m.66723 type:complete len:108 (+) Transcript_33687:416-739(+)